MTKRADIGLKTLLCTNSLTLLKVTKSGALSVKMTQRADLGLNNSVLYKLVQFAENH